MLKDHEIDVLATRSIDRPEALESPELVVVLPTFNEVGNVEPILAKLDQALTGIRWEVVFVDDDSKDGTAAAVVAAAQRRAHVRIIRRIGRRGLSTAAMEGALSSMAPVIAVMDSDLQHDEAILPEMLRRIRTGEINLVIGTRYADGGGIQGLSGNRALISKTATRLAHMLTRTQMSDPMSGFFMITREAFDRSVRKTSGQGFKILLDLAASAETPLRISEVPYQFRERSFGESKLDSMVALEYLLLLLDKTVGKYVPSRFILFTAVGCSGLLIHMTVLAISLGAAKLSFPVGQGIATFVAMTFNFFLNNFLTYRDRRIKGAWRLAKGLLSFCLVCSLGAFANVGIANYIFNNRYSWWLAGIAGVLIGAVWNYAASSVFTWGRR